MSLSDEYPAHIRIKDSSEEVQSVLDHCLSSASYAASALAGIGLSNTAYLAGFLHDIGKCKDEFKEYLESAINNGSVICGSVNHTFAGVRFVLERFHSENDSEKRLTAEVVAYAIGAHHGLFNCLDEFGKSGFNHRLEKSGISYGKSVNNFKQAFEHFCLNDQQSFDGYLEDLFTKASDEVTAVIKRIESLMPDSEGEYSQRSDEEFFYAALLSRLILSAVIEGDRKDTAEFLDDQFEPKFSFSMEELWDECINFAEAKHQTLVESSLKSPVNKAREDIAQQCLSLSDYDTGIYTLNTPTGSGKTLSVLRAVLAHAKLKQKSRIVFTFPLLTILEQNAKEIKSNIPQEEYVIEHHSNVVHSEHNEDCLDCRELLTQTWHAPIVVTTLVQLLNTLFAGQTSCIRRFQSLCNSIIVIDEVQTVPINMLSLFNSALNFLTKVCGATIILCSATQPTLNKTPHPLAVDPIDLVPFSEDLWLPFKRTKIVNSGKKELSEIPGFAHDVLEKASSLLIVCNKKDEALYLFKQLNETVDYCFHLSASMCAAHREETLDRLKHALELIRKDESTKINSSERAHASGKSKSIKVICVATQVVEAGVDISFDRVIRFAAGMDNIIQAFGRQNRNGECPEPTPAYVVNCKDEKLNKLKDIQRAKNATVNVFDEFKRNPRLFDSDLSSRKTIEKFYSNLYGQLSPSIFNYPLHGKHETLYDLLSCNLTRLSKYQNSLTAQDSPSYILNQSFLEAGKAFQVFDSKTDDVIVPYGDRGKKLIEDFCSEETRRNFRLQCELVEQAKRYSISIYEHQKEELEKSGGIIPLCDGLILALNTGFYSEEYGLNLDLDESNFLEV